MKADRCGTAPCCMARLLPTDSSAEHNFVVLSKQKQS